MVEYQEIVIDWKERAKWNPNSFDQIGEKNVIYQFYCDSHIYGRNVLAYIGKTDRVFKKRLGEHEKLFFQFAKNINYSIGVISEKINLEIPESILIANHKPFFNKDFIHNISSKAKSNKILIINNGDYGMLKSCCTNYWWVNNEK